ncbi:MAG: 50S ribosomal protein L5 [Microgenomates group bacterium]
MPASSLKHYRIEKVIVNMGVGEGAHDPKAIEMASNDLMAITGQKPVVCRAKASEAGFKIKKGDPIGLKVTLRGKRMEGFLKKLFHIVLPRLKDFQGVSLKGFDGRGNYSLGIPEQIVFPEIDYSKIDKIRGLGINIVTNTKNDEEAKKLLEEMGMPFEKVKS